MVHQPHQLNFSLSLQVENLSDVQLQVRRHGTCLARQAQLDVSIPQTFTKTPGN